MKNRSYVNHAATIPLLPAGDINLMGREGQPLLVEQEWWSGGIRKGTTGETPVAPVSGTLGSMSY